MTSTDNVERQYWLWVTRPKHYLDEEGNDREDLDPETGKGVGGWWTCHKNTGRGDLVFLWRTTPKQDIAYLIQAKSDAYSIIDQSLQQHGTQEAFCLQYLDNVLKLFGRHKFRLVKKMTYSVDAKFFVFYPIFLLH